MEKTFEKYKALSKVRQFWIAFFLFIFGLILLPNTFVYAFSTYAFSKVLEKKFLRYTLVPLFAIFTFFSSILWLAESFGTPPVTEQVPTQMIEEEVEEDFLDEEDQIVEERLKEEEGAIPVPEERVSVVEVVQKEPVVEESDTLYEVVQVVDGDTVKLNIDGKTETIRLIGIDTPETVHPSKPVECFGLEASNKAKELLYGSKVSLETDDSQGVQDRYGRLLGYIILADGTNFNKLMIEQGYAYEYTYSTPYKYQSEFKSAEQSARTNKVGLWADGVCEEEVVTQEVQPTVSSGGNWYVSSHHSSKYYYCEESDGWKSLSKTYLKVYGSEDELLVAFPYHTLHESCK